MNFTTYHSGSKGNLYQVDGDAGSLLIDPGVTIRKVKKALNFKLSEISGCLCSHHHADHSKAIHDIAKAGIDCFMLKETAQALKFSGHRLNVIEPLRQFKIGSFSIVPVEIHHQDVITGERIPGVGFLISDRTDKLLYFCDSFYCKYRFGQLGIIALGVNYSKKTMNPNLNTARKKRLFKSHMSLETAIKFFKANDLSKIREIHLLHISSENGDPEYFKSEIMKATGKPVFV
ncbi:MAG TPA: MBL fold metallo-hydrolase [Desulfobacterales bacterium]|nr:MBL fold metallo-hydrolase [Desulfobacterales bacterium]